jgi:ubiquinone/menaquinone biosynthesis C-methylase UbiE
MNKAKQRAEMPKGSATILNSRSLEKDYRTLIPILKKGIRVLDIGCGPGAISKGIADKIGSTGQVVGIDSSKHLIEEGKQAFANTSNLELHHKDLFTYQPKEKFDLIVSARVLQWLNNPKEALKKIKTWLKPGGQVSILDYNHEALEWSPTPPKSMLEFYQAFLDWRSDAGMNNAIAEDLPTYFKELGFQSIEIIESNEVYKKGAANFLPKLGIWIKVAETRGIQVQTDGHVKEALRLKAIEEYKGWMHTDAIQMIMKLKEIRGKL